MNGVKNYSVAVKERGNDIVFLRRIVPGGTDRSYGVHVARLAGLPKKVIDRAQDILEEYDNCETACSVQITPRAEKETAPMGSLFASSLQQQILKMDVMAMTPIEALNALYKLQDEAKREGGEL